MIKSRVTLSDVAKKSGVSKITVSRALLSNPDWVAPQTRDRIHAAAKELGYVPDLTASALSSRKSRLVATLVSTFSASIFTSIIESLQSELAVKSLQLLVGQTDYSLENETELIRLLLGRNPDGLVITSGIHNDETKRLLKNSGIPVVEIWDLPVKPIDMAIGFDNQKIGNTAGSYLAGMKYQRPALVTNRAGKNIGSVSDIRTRQRWEGFKYSYKTKMSNEPELLEILDGAEYIHGNIAMKAMIREGLIYDAIFFDSDTLAAGAVFACMEAGLQLPADVAIIGFGGFPIAESIFPKLTTIKIPLKKIGQYAGEQIIRKIEGREIKKKTIEVEPIFVKADTA